MEMTGFYLEEPRIMFDAGIPLPSPETHGPHAICITHGHIDHANALPLLLRHSLSDGAGMMHLLGPREILPRLADFGQMSWAIKVGMDQPLPPQYAPAPPAFVSALMGSMGGTPVPGPTYKPGAMGLGQVKAWTPMDDGSTITIPYGRKAGLGKGDFITLEAMALTHTTPTRGYLLSTYKKVLRDDLRVIEEDGTLNKKATGLAVRSAKEAGEEVNETLKLDVFAFLCDTTTEIFFDPVKREKLLTFSTLVVECTYLTSTSEDGVDLEDEAEKRGHVCWSGEKGLGKVFGSWESVDTTTWILIHFSLRHSDPDIREFFMDKDACGFDFREAGDDETPHLILWLDSGIVKLII